jgi:hypothetical protein
LEKVPWAAEENVYCDIAEWNSLCISVRSIQSMVSFSSRVSLLIFFFLDDLSLGDSRVLKPPTATVLELNVFLSPLVYVIKLGTLTLDAYRLIIIISFWCTAPFISLKCPSLSHLTNFSLKSTLSDISIAIPAWFGGPLAW